MFERKNQNVLSEHYMRMIEHDDHDIADPEEEDFITLKRADHELEDGDDLSRVKLENLSNRKMKLSSAKRKIILNAPTAKKLVFDDSGEGHVAHDVQPAEEWIQEKGGIEGVKEVEAKFTESERGKMRNADVIDKAEMREKKREKKRKRKDREKNSHQVSVNCLFFRASTTENEPSGGWDCVRTNSGIPVGGRRICVPGI
jgi:ATP-dependent RNA helicase DDX10/DBP4